MPVKTTLEGPSIKISPRPGQSILRIPPGDATAACSPARPALFAAASAAQAPVPHPRVGPTDLSHVRILRDSGDSTAHQVTFIRCGKAGCDSSLAETAGITFQNSCAGAKITACGVPTSTQVIRQTEPSTERG